MSHLISQHRRPNVLLLYTDQQRWDSLRCYGSEFAQTPNIDRLAFEGALLERFFVQSPVCAPSRMSFLTGRYCSSIGVGCNGMVFPEHDATPLPSLLKPYGYRTANFGKLHFTPHANRDHAAPHPTFGFDTLMLSDQPGSYDDAYLAWVRSMDPKQEQAVRLPVHPVPQKYGHKSHKPQRDEYDPMPFEGADHLTHTAFVAAETCRFLETNGQQPFFAISGFFYPHAPLVPPKKYVDRFDVQSMPLPRLGPNETMDSRLAGKSQEQLRTMVAYYAALCAEIDDHVGRILQTLERIGQADNTVVIFTSDHGEFLGDHGRLGKSMPGHDCITRVPAIVRFPGRIPAGRRIPALVEAVDVVPTILDYCGIQIPAFVQGSSLCGLLDGRTDAHRDDVLTESFLPGGPTETTVRTARLKYYRHSDGRELLWDLENDPQEFRDVAAEPYYQPALLEMRGRMISRIQHSARSYRPRLAEW